MNPVILIPWQNDFLPALGQHLVERDDFSQCTVLFPHNRPRRYLKDYFKGHPDLNPPVFLPRMTSIAEFVSSIRRNLTDTPVTLANQLDLVEMLREIVNDLRITGRGLLARLPELDRESFLPWGIRLAKLMDDLLRQDIEPEDLKYMEGEVSAYASGLLEQLSSIHHEYVTRLFARNWTTPGLDWRFITNNIKEVSAHLSGTPVVAAGFYALSGAEDIFFRRLWEDGILTPIIHSDPVLAEGKRPHWSAAEHTAWLERWKTKVEIPTDIPRNNSKPSIRFCEGFDRHSQLAALTDDMHKTTDLDRTAIILPDEGALMPVLHHLPEVEPNISMGYPLERTSLARLVEIIISLQENRLEDGRYSWRDVIALIRHPYLRLLGPDNKPLRKIFHIWEAAIRMGERYVHPLHWEPPYDDPILDGVDKKVAEPLRQEILHHCLTAFEQVHSLETLGEALTGLAVMLHTHGEKLWHGYLVDAECLFRLTTSVIPQLQSVETGSEEFRKTTLFALLRRIISQERVSFEAEPLAGLQILGVLETRLLQFKRLFILDAVEDRLPGTNPYDPLLPDALRKVLGLPDTRERDNVSGYNFYRLLMGAEEAVIYYQSGIQPGLLDSKSVRSRFVEQLLWEIEKKEKRIIETGDEVIRAVTFPAGSLQQDARSIPVTKHLRTLLETTLREKGLSPSRLDQYLQCPKQFFYYYLAKIRPIDHLDEDGDRSEFGTLIHNVLREHLSKYIGQKTDLAALDPLPLTALFDQRFRESELYAQIPHDTRLALTNTGRHRLTTFLASQEPAKLLSLEQQIHATVDMEGLIIPLNGQLDRVEERDEGIFIMDYKTGGGVLPKKAFWEDMNLWDRLHEFGPENTDPMLLNDLSKSVQSVQLPVYMHLYSESEETSPFDAGLIKLGEDGKTDYVFGKKWADLERREAINEMTPVLVKTLIRHMLTATQYTAQPGRRCQWCDFKAPCGA
ncbi:PD-(D/E)XK nuclease family protein [Pseudodesulfovibrio sp. zrk46]|uniref:PD-(D/E)XK nuclease family protein n=1 Tax=Pseudodesulfovibrio sp. zrk46 TaxID=2725288 RepID=UPI0014494E37|nr:PD-(D/E)XK nuclease family protein [Pseudodesulfovibrio sp. zrk46]QJB57918.1 PD-(D/E)XK nuclease family protein [Pseudodesulfovibrio sp. zrk46]